MPSFKIDFNTAFFTHFFGRIYYGDRVHYLCTSASVADIRVVMNDISHVVQAMLKRLRADLLQDDVAVALHAFDLLAWESSNNHVHLHTPA